MPCLPAGRRYIDSSLSIRRFWGKRGKMEAKKGETVLSNHCHIQILDVSHDLLNGFVSGLPFSSPPSSIKNLSSPIPLRRPDTQANETTINLHLNVSELTIA